MHPMSLTRAEGTTSLSVSRSAERMFDLSRKDTVWRWSETARKGGRVGFARTEQTFLIVPKASNRDQRINPAVVHDGASPRGPLGNFCWRLGALPGWLSDGVARQAIGRGEFSTPFTALRVFEQER